MSSLFIPSASATGLTVAGGPGSVALPAIDPNNQDLTILNNSVSPMSVNFGTGQPPPVRVDMAGATVVLPGQTKLVPAIQGNANFASFISVDGGSGATVVFTRGTATPQQIF